MDFGKLSSIENVNFALPPDHPETARQLRGVPPREGLPRILIGCTGWSVKEWVGWIYPKGCKSTDYLLHYGKQFDTIELNTTHYRTPSVADVQKWKKQTPADFRFAPKMLQTVSHAKNLAIGNNLTEPFIESLLHFEEKLGICFMQLPPYFGYNDLKVLEIFLKKYAKLIPLAIEIRDDKLFAHEAHLNTYFHLLEHFGVATVITDVAGRRDVLHQRLTTRTALIRFVGNDLDPTDFTRVNEWVTRLKTWFEMGLHDVYFFSHQPDNIQSPRIARYFYDKITATFPAQLRGVIFEDEKKPSQPTLF